MSCTNFFQHQRVPSLIVAAESCCKQSFKVLWNFISSAKLNFSRQELKQILLNEHEGTTVFHIAMIRKDCGIFHFVVNLYHQLFGKEKIEEIVNGNVGDSSLLMFVIDNNLDKIAKLSFVDRTVSVRKTHR